MSPYYTFRSFAIYLAVSIIITEAPVSAFTVRRTRTTTLKSASDLTGEESALLEVKNDLPKINNSKGNMSQKETTPSEPFKALAKEVPTRTSGNALDIEKKSTQSMDMSNNEVLRPINVNKEIETTHLTSKDDNISKPTVKKHNSSNSDNTDSVTKLTDFTTSEISTTTHQEPSEKTTVPNAITMGQISVDAIQVGQANVEDITEINSKTLLATEASSLIAGTETVNKNVQPLDIKEHSTEPVTPPDTTVTETQSTYGSENKLITESNSKQTETMMVEASSTVTKNPSWKTYTTIERKRTTSAEPDSTENSELLTNADTMPPKITLESAATYTPIPSLDELRQELINNSITYNSRSTAEPLTSLPNEPSTITIPTLVSEVPPTSNSHTGPDNIVTSKRAGFLDLTAKQSDSNNVTTTKTDSLNLNETEMVGSLFEVDLQENDNPETKNASVSQSQMEEDAIREKLLEEQIFNDNIVKNYQTESKSAEVSDGKIAAEDSLSVKPINPKSNIYTVSPQYKKMKKIEVQPLKPFIRDPDDNSWRNESLSLLGIVFKAKNASKPFTQVLKNKTEAELNNIPEKDEKNEVTDLRVRLEKIAEVRKSRKKKINKAGETVYSDYEESTSGEASTTPKSETTLPLFDADGKLAFVGQTTPLTATSSEATTKSPGVYMHKEEVLTTKKPVKANKFSEYYDTTDEYDADYVTLPKIDLKKFTTGFYTKDTASTPPMPGLLTTHVRPLTTHWPDRKPTVQYFPPKTNHPKFTFADYDSGFEKKFNMFSFDDVPKVATRVTPGTTPTTPRTHPPTQPPPPPPPPVFPLKPVNKTADLFKNFYMTVPTPRADEFGGRTTGADDETFNRASYVIKHYKDLIDEAVKDDYDKNGEYVQTYTDAPLTGVTVDESARGRTKPSIDEDYDYVAGFRKDILNKFVDTFNQNSERFKVDFPILYNSSVVHRAAGSGERGAVSRAALRRGLGRACDPHCELRVELSPAYELHYYVPDQEEREPAEPRPPAPQPYAYRL